MAPLQAQEPITVPIEDYRLAIKTYHKGGYWLLQHLREYLQQGETIFLVGSDSSLIPLTAEQIQADANRLFPPYPPEPRTLDSLKYFLEWKRKGWF